MAKCKVQKSMAQKTSIEMEQSEEKAEKEPRIRRGRVDSLDLYEITDYELDILTTGSPSSIFLNFAVSMISVACSFLIALLTTTISSIHIFSVFVIIVTICFIAGLILFIIWLKSRKDTTKIIQRIRKRMPTENYDESGG